MPAMVTQEPSRQPMVGQGNRALEALPNVATLTTLDEVRIPSPVQEEDYLLLALKPSLNPGNQLLGEDPTTRLCSSTGPSLPPTLPHGFQIDNPNGRKATTSNPIREGQVAKLTLSSVLPTLQ